MGELAAVGSAILWAYASIEFARVAERCSALTINLLKCTGGLICLSLLWGVLDGFTLGVVLTASEWTYLLFSAVVGLLLGDTFFFLTLRDLGARVTLLISALIPPVTALISSAWIGEGLAASEWLGLVITGVGVCLVVSKNEGGQPAHLRGLLFGGLLVGTTALGNVMTKVGGHRLDGLPVAALRLAVAVGALFLVMAILRRLPDLAVPWRTPRVDGALMRGTFTGTVLGIWLLMFAFTSSNVAVATAMAGTSPVWVLPLAYLLRGERISRRSGVGAAIAVGGLMVLALS